MPPARPILLAATLPGLLYLATPALSATAGGSRAHETPVCLLGCLGDGYKTGGMRPTEAAAAQSSAPANATSLPSSHLFSSTTLASSPHPLSPLFLLFTLGARCPPLCTLHSGCSPSPTRPRPVPSLPLLSPPSPLPPLSSARGSVGWGCPPRWCAMPPRTAPSPLHRGRSSRSGRCWWWPSSFHPCAPSLSGGARGRGSLGQRRRRCPGLVATPWRPPWWTRHPPHAVTPCRPPRGAVASAPHRRGRPAAWQPPPPPRHNPPRRRCHQ